MAKITPVTCDTIDWLVYFLGTNELLKAVGECEVFVSTDKIIITRHTPDQPSSADGLYFDGSHWYAKRDGVTYHSYSSNYQKHGTAHFCQTFALMIYMKEPENKLVAGKHANNIAEAMKFWATVFEQKNWAKLAPWLVKQINKSDDPSAIRYPELKNLTVDQFIKHLATVAKAADSLVGCRLTHPIHDDWIFGEAAWRSQLFTAPISARSLLGFCGVNG